MAYAKKWTPLFTTQFLGILNDNFLKNCIIFISVLWLSKEDEGMVISLASALLVLPFVLFSPLAGRLAQIYSKQKIYEYAKLAEIPIMAIAVIGFFAESLPIVMTALFLMGLQSALYAPSKYGLIRDVGGHDGLSYGVGTMELLTFLGALLGQVFAGLISDLSIGVSSILATILISLAISGYFTSRFIKVKEEKPLETSKDPVEPFTFLYQTAKWAKGIRGLNTTILGLGSFWLVAAMIQMNIYVHAPDIYNLSNTGTALVMAIIAIGIGLGCFISGKLSKNRVELGMVPLGGLGLSILITIFAIFELSLYPFVICLFFAAMFSGFYKVPLSAWLQERVEGRKVGRALAYNQMMAFLFILLAAGIFGYVEGQYDTYAVFAVIAAISWIMTIITIVNIPAMMVRFIAYILAHSYFKIEIDGAENVPRKSGALLVANHLSMLDPFFIVAAVPRMLRFVVTKGVFDFKPLKWILTKLNMIPIAEKLDMVKLEEFNELCRKEVNQGHILCIFPEGQISRIGHLLEFKKGIEHIAKGVDVPIIPVRMSGVKGTPLSFEIGSSKPIMPWFKGFRNKISIQIGEPLPPESSANLLRQKVQLLNAFTFEKRIRDYHTLPYFMKKTARRLKSREFQFGGVQSSFQSFYVESQLKSGFWNRTTNQYVGIDVGNHMQMGLFHASCLFAGKIPVFFQPEMSEELKNTIISEYGLDCILSNIGKEDIHVSPDVFFATTSKQAAKSHSDNIVGIFWEKDHDGKWLSLAMTHTNFLASIRGFMHLFNKPTDAKVYADLLAYTTYGNLANIWLPYFFGMSIYKPEEGIEISALVSSDKINTLFTNLLTVLDLNETLTDSDWQKLNYVLTGNETLPELIKTRLQEQDVFVSESLAITGGGVTVAMNTPDFEVVGIGGGKPMLQEGSQGGSVGRPLPGMGIKILDEQGNDVPAGEKGNLFVYGSGICNDYKDDQGWLDAKIRASVDDKGFLYLA